MTVEINYAITIATFSDWLKDLVPIFQPSKILNRIQWHLASTTFSVL